VAATPVRITALLPNPAGPDEGHGAVTLRNTGESPVDLTGWTLRDRAENEFQLSGQIAGGSNMELVMASHDMPLNNGGDTVEVVRPDGTIAHSVSYTGEQVLSGQPVAFE
jgi:hypothetical protein